MRLFTLLAVGLLWATTACAQTPTGPLEGLPDRSPAKGIDTPVTANQATVILAGMLHTQQRTSAGKWRAPIENGVVVISGGKITAVGARSAVTIPAGARVIEAPIVTPGLIDARSVVGLSGWLNSRHDQDQIENSEPIQSELDRKSVV